MRSSWFVSLDLDEALRADSLIAAARMIDIGWIVEEAYRTLDSISVDGRLRLHGLLDGVGPSRMARSRWICRGCLYAGAGLDCTSLTSGVDWLLPGGKDLIVVPGAIEFLERSVEGCELPLADKL